MAATEQLGRSKKRKRDPPTAAKAGGKKPYTKKQPERAPSNPQTPPAKGSEKPRKPSKFHPVKPSLSNKSVDLHQKKEPKSPKERRLAAKEEAEAKKKKRRLNYSLEKELASSWEKMRCYNIGKEERSKLISEALRKMTGKVVEIASSHVTARVLQTCVKYCSQAERESVFETLRPHLLTLSRKKYAVHLVKKILDSATKNQLEGFISSLHGRVASLLRHAVGSAVVEHVFHLGNGSQKQSLLMEMYSTELQLFKDLTLTNSGRLVDVISKLELQKSSVVQHMTSVIQHLLEKRIVDYSIIHTVLVEYFTIADKSSATNVIQQLVPLLVHESAATDEGPQLSAPHISRKRNNKRSKFQVPLLVRMMHTRAGLKVGILCIKHGSAKERKKIIKGIKAHIGTLALDQGGSLLLVCILSVVDDTKLVTKIVIHELQKMLKELILDRNGRRPILQLLHPLCPRYFGPDDLACLNLSVPSLCTQGEGADALTGSGSNRPLNVDMVVSMTDNNSSEVCTKSMHIEGAGKKDPSLRRNELLVESHLAEGLIETCIENVGELLRSNFGKEVLYEVAVGGTNGVLKSLADRVDALQKAIASLASQPKTNGSEEGEHVLENFHSSRTIRKLVLDCPAFAATLWSTALQGKCEMWAQGHSCKVVNAFLELSDSKVGEIAKSELQPLIDRGVLKAPREVANR